MWNPARLAVVFLLVGCGGDDTQPNKDGNGGTDGTDGTPAICGDGVLYGSEHCDQGAANGDDANCLSDCTWNSVQRLVLTDQILAAAERSDLAYEGSGSWCATGSDKFELDLEPFLWGAYDPLGEYTVADIAEVSFATNKSGGNDDFYLQAYTKSDGIDDTGSWYGYRLTAHTHLSKDLVSMDNEWNLWSTDSAENQLTFYDRAFTNGGFQGQPTLAEIVADPELDWTAWNPEATASGVDYAGETVKRLSLQTDSGWDTFDGCLDSIAVVLVDGRALYIDLE